MNNKSKNNIVLVNIIIIINKLIENLNFFNMFSKHKLIQDH